MAGSTYYLTAGLPAIDSADKEAVKSCAFYMTAGLMANDYVAAGGAAIPLDDRGILRGIGRGINRGMSRIQCRYNT